MSLKLSMRINAKKALRAFFLVSYFFIPNFSFAALPAGFEIQTIASGFDLPTTIAFTNDGRIFVAEKGGAVKVIKNGVLLPTPLITLSDINAYGDRGLIGMAIHPNFSSNGYLYLLYTYENTPGFNIAGPKTGRLVRVTVTGDLSDESTKMVILGSIGGNVNTPSCENYPVTSDCISSDSLSHSVGGLRFGPDGKLYVTLGDGASFDFADPKSLKAQNLDALAGKLLRINTDGTAPIDNPFYNGLNTSNRSKVYSLGLRNAFRFNFRPTNESLFFGDVGWNTWEEINLVSPGANFGWPCREGASPTPGGLNPCNTISTTTDPIYYYVHDSNGAGSVTSGAFPTGGAYPSSYLNTMFFGDYAQNWIKMMDLNSNNQVVSVQNFGGASDGVDGPVEFLTGPEGNVYFLGIYTGTLKKITHTSGNRQPIVNIFATPTSGLAPLIVNFNSTGTNDPDGDPITYLWNFGNNATSSEPNPIYTYDTNGSYIASLSVSDNQGGVTTKNITITVGNQAPTATITEPPSGFLYSPNEVVTLSGTGFDPETGNLSGSSLSWRVILHHNTHLHTIQTATGSPTSYVAPDHSDPDVYTEVELTVTDPAGLQNKTSVNIYLNNGATSGNLILNPSVENPDSGNPSFPQSWLTGFYGILNPTFTYPVAGQDGLDAVRVTVSGHTSGDAKWYFSPISVTENTEYKFYDYYTSTAPSFVTAQIGYADGTFSYIGLGTAPTTGTFTKHERVFTTPPGAKTLTVFHSMATNGTLTTDNFYLALNSTSTPDTTPPSVSVTAPTAGQTISGNFTFMATSTDNVSVAGVTFLLDGIATGTEDVIAPYFLTLNTNTLSNGSHTISARAIDTSNNTTTSGPVLFSVLNSTSTPGTTTPNLITNGNMEIVSTTTAGNPYAWKRGGWGINTSVFTYPISGYSGNGSTVSITSYTNGDAKWYSNDITVVPGQTYDISWQYKSNATTSSLLRYTSTTGAFSYPTLSSTISPSSEWTKVTHRITIPSGQTKLTAFHILKSVGTLSTDEFTLTTIDNVLPQVSITSPLPNQTVSGTYNFTASSTDNVGVSLVKFFVDGIQIGQSSTAPFIISYNTTSLSNGSHTVLANSSDLSGNTATSTPISFIVSNSTSTPDNIAPQVSITTPGNGATVSNTISITASSTDNVAVSGVQFKLDGINLGNEVLSPPYTVSWNTASTSNATHNISAVARDSSNNISSTTISVTVSNTVATTSQNLILNGNLEIENGINPLGWTRGGWGQSTKVYNYPIVGHDGNKAAGFTVTNYVDGDVKWAFTPVDVSPGVVYRYSDYFKGSTITDIIGQYTLENGSFAYFGLIKEIPPASNWTYISGDFTPPVGVRKVTLFHLISTNGTVSIDDASLVSIGTTTPATDLTPPVVEFTNPLAGANLSGTVNITASSTDNVGVTYVVYALNGNIISPNLTISPYSYLWDTTQVTNGSHILKATTHDSAGNNSNIQIPVTINNQSGTTTQSNIIDNPSFEITAANGDPESWNRGGWGTNNRTYNYPVPGRNTAKAARVSMTSYTNGDVKWYFNPKSIIPGNQYNFSNYYMSDITSNVTLRYTRSDGTFMYVGLGNLPASPTWTQYQTTFIPPADVTQVTVFHSISGVGSLTVDDYSLSMVDTNNNPNAFTEGMVSLTFDDGWLSHYTEAMPILNSANMDATFGIVSQETINAGNEVNRISNPSVEIVGANGDPEDWFKGGWGTSSTTFSYPVSGQNGNNAARITVSDYVSGDRKWFFKDATVIPGQTYRFSNYYISDTSSVIFVRFNVGTATDVYQYSYIGTLPAQADWTQYSVDINVPSNAHSMTVFHMLQSNGTLTVDNYSLMRVQFFVNPSQVLELSSSGHEISSHTRTHASLTTIPVNQMQSEIIDSKSDLITMGVSPVDTIIYPFGDHNDLVKQTSQSAGYIGARSVLRGYNDKITDKFALKIQQINATTTVSEIQSWIDVARQTKTWLILMFHQIDLSGSSLSATPATLQAVVNYINSISMPQITLTEGIQLMNP
jgi:glucose/arabinose dehydrogenase/peptidoglycan/xylan/chitin deacetylase (PgdA/CDA1 family)